MGGHVYGIRKNAERLTYAWSHQGYSGMPEFPDIGSLAAWGRCVRTEGHRVVLFVPLFMRSLVVTGQLGLRQREP